MKFNPKENYKKTKESSGYISRDQATQEDYDKIGFMSGLEVHQQLLTREKLFCHCPAGIYNKNDDYDAELVRHMRPTLSELGEYDGTALMEFKTRKEIFYRIKNNTACTYEVDDTPPFPMNREALDIAVEISLLSKLNIVGEVHITRKQYLDGSIPTGFQRTAILGVEGEIDLPHKKIRLIQLSIEEDSCREISDIGHIRVLKTDRLGMPLIETVTYPDCVNPDEVKETCNYIRFLNRSTAKVRTGMGAARQDVNVSCKGGSRVEIKGVAHTKWIPELTHIEVFRQWALLKIRDLLLIPVSNPEKWTIHSESVQDKKSIRLESTGEQLLAVNLPMFKGILSHFTQPGKIFADEISDRLKVIACLEKPNMAHSESLENSIPEEEWEKIRVLLKAGKEDAQVLIWGPEEDMQTALETIEERCKMAFVGVPDETRKSFENGTTIFERVLPGADRMYPDTDTVPIPLTSEYIEERNKQQPEDIIERYRKLKSWNIPEDTYTYIFSKNYFPLLQKIIGELKPDPKYIGTFLGHKLKFTQGQIQGPEALQYSRVYEMFAYLEKKEIQVQLAEKMIPHIIEHPKMDFGSVLESIKFKRVSDEDIYNRIPLLKAKFREESPDGSKKNELNWIMGQLRKTAIGNVKLSELSEKITVSQN